MSAVYQISGDEWNCLIFKLDPAYCSFVFVNIVSGITHLVFVLISVWMLFKIRNIDDEDIQIRRFDDDDDGEKIPMFYSRLTGKSKLYHFWFWNLCNVLLTGLLLFSVLYHRSEIAAMQMAISSLNQAVRIH